MLSGVFNILKPPGMTSHDVVSFIRRVAGVKKAGHAGTLDPDAAGVLPVFAGRATRLAEYMANDDKCYRAQLLFGVKTDTGDDSGMVIARKAAPQFAVQDIMRVLESFTGRIYQIPPMYSAVKYQGKRLYQLAREGKSVERQPRPVEIHEMKILRQLTNGLLLDISCSKGTYIRSLLEDIAEGLGSVGTMVFLLRTRAGGFTIQNSRLLGELEKNPAGCLLPADIAIRHLPRFNLNDNQAKRFCQGVPITMPVYSAGVIRVYAGEIFLGIGEMDGDKLRGQKILADSTIF